MVHLSWQAETMKRHRKLKYLLSSECDWKAFTPRSVIDLNEITHHWLVELYIQQGIFEVIYLYSLSNFYLPAGIGVGKEKKEGQKEWLR